LTGQQLRPAFGRLHRPAISDDARQSLRAGIGGKDARRAYCGGAQSYRGPCRLAACLLFAAGSLFAIGAAPSSIGSQSDRAAKPVVPLRVQRLLKERASLAAYVPIRLPPGYRYFTYQSFNAKGFDIFFTCCDDNLPLIGFHTVLVKRSEPCNEGSPAKVFRIDGVLIGWNAGHNDQYAWRCIRRGSTRLLIAVSGEPLHAVGTSWRTPRQLARMVASARPIK